MNEMNTILCNAELMSGNTLVGIIRQNHVIPVCKELLPLCFTNGGDITDWLKRRAIDCHRTNARLLKKVLRLKHKDDVSTALHFNAATITDNYWIRPAGSSLRWEDVQFRANDFSDLALMGKLSDFAKKPSRTPELTNIGSFEKCWRYENGAWWMHKAENDLERFSELFIYELCKALNFPTAVYQASGEFIKTVDFTGGELNYEPAAYLMGDNRDYASNYRMFQSFGQNIADSYVEIILMDTFCCNVDRHTYNYGLLHDRWTGDVISLAPNFDNNIALISDGYDAGLERSDYLIGLLNEFEQQTHAVADYLTRHKAPVIMKDMVCACCDATGIPVDKECVCQLVMNGYENVKVK